MDITILVMGDSPLIHTGFSEPIRQALDAFGEQGWTIEALAFMDPDRRPVKERLGPMVVERNIPGSEEKYSFKLHPSFLGDDLFHGHFDTFFRKVKPDVAFIITDPVNLYNYLYRAKKQGVTMVKLPDKRDFVAPFVSYTPIEGVPIPLQQGQGIELVEWFGGKPLLYHEWAVKAIRQQYPHLTPDFAHHGLDHADFRPYTEEERTVLRKLAGLDKYFVVGCGGVNKRTKGLDTMIYAARELKDMDRHYGIKIYLHTNEQPTMQGYPLNEMVDYYDVGDIILFKQYAESYWTGSPRDDSTLEQAMSIKDNVPDFEGGRWLMWDSYDFISKINCFDLYIDPSEVEGWGFWPGEAMACGVPVAQVKDYGIRDEIYGCARYEIPSLDQRLWRTWHSGAKLVGVDPREVAKAILTLKSNPNLRRDLAQRGLTRAKKYKWANYRKKLVETVKEVVRKDRALMELDPEKGWRV